MCLRVCVCLYLNVFVRVCVCVNLYVCLCDGETSLAWIEYESAMNKITLEQIFERF